MFKRGGARQPWAVSVQTSKCMAALRRAPAAGLRHPQPAPVGSEGHPFLETRDSSDCNVSSARQLEGSRMFVREGKGFHPPPNPLSCPPGQTRSVLDDSPRLLWLPPRILSLAFPK